MTTTGSCRRSTRLWKPLGIPASPCCCLFPRPSDSAAKTRVATLIKDPSSIRSPGNFVVAQVPPQEEEALGQAAGAPADLLGGEDLPPEAVEVIVTEDGETPSTLNRAPRRPPESSLASAGSWPTARPPARPTPAGKLSAPGRGVPTQPAHARDSDAWVLCPLSSSRSHSPCCMFGPSQGACCSSFARGLLPRDPVPSRLRPSRLPRKPPSRRASRNSPSQWSTAYLRMIPRSWNGSGPPTSSTSSRPATASRRRRDRRAQGKR